MGWELNFEARKIKYQMMVNQGIGCPLPHCENSKIQPCLSTNIETQGRLIP